MTAAHALALLLALIPHNSPAFRAMNAQREHIAALAEDASREFGVPVALLLSIGFRETWCGTHPHEGGNWGAPKPGGDRHIAGTARDAGRILRRGFVVCGSWLGSAARFRSGACRGNPVGDRYAVRAIAFMARLTN